MSFLPISKNDLVERNIKQLDFIIVSGDAYVDHPSFGVAIISRIIEREGFTCGIISQPNWKDLESFNVLGTPKYGFLVTAGNIDSMVNHYTVAKKIRSKDYYSPAGKMGLRPDRATIVYSNKIREKFGKIPIIIGGIEASLRRLSHYDYWDNKVRRSILLDSSADLLVYGMAENQITSILHSLKNKIDISNLNFIDGTSYVTKNIENISDYIKLPSFLEVSSNKKKYAESFLIQYNNTDPITSKILIEEYKEGFVVQNKPSKFLTTSEMDKTYSLPYERDYHPVYEKSGGIPAIIEVKHSIISNRGCFGDCNFCALTFHQGRIVQTRSHKSILAEAEKITWDKDFKGYINDVGGPTANFRIPSCEKQLTKGTCKSKRCLYPKVCDKMNVSHKDYLVLLKKIRSISKIKKVFIRSGIRYDYLMADKNRDEFINELCKHHVSGQLKVAPEHVSKKVLDMMGKPPIEIFDKFKEKYYNVNKSLGMKQFLVPYLMSSHPGSDINDAIELALYLKKNNLTPEQVQDFYPTPGTLSTCMYYTEIDPTTNEKVFVEKNPHKKAIQRALMQYKLPQNYDLVSEGLRLSKRNDLIGFGENALIRPRKMVKNDFRKDKPKEFIKDKPKEFVKKKTIRNVHKTKIK